MASPSVLGDIGFPVSAVLPLSTTTALYYIKGSGTDTGTIALTSRVIELSRPLYLSGAVSTGKPLDVTVHPRAAGAPRWRSVAVAIAGEWTSHTSGKNLYLSVAHQCRAATSGAGSTWRTLRTTVDRFKMGTDTDVTYHLGTISAANLQGSDKFYRAVTTISFKMASSTAAKDTTTNQAPTFFNSAILLLSAGEQPTNVPARVS